MVDASLAYYFFVFFFFRSTFGGNIERSAHWLICARCRSRASEKKLRFLLSFYLILGYAASCGIYSYFLNDGSNTMADETRQKAASEGVSRREPTRWKRKNKNGCPFSILTKLNGVWWIAACTKANACRYQTSLNGHNMSASDGVWRC